MPVLRGLHVPTFLGSAASALQHQPSPASTRRKAARLQCPLVAIVGMTVACTTRQKQVCLVGEDTQLLGDLGLLTS